MDQQLCQSFVTELSAYDYTAELSSRVWLPGFGAHCWADAVCQFKM